MKYALAVIVTLFMIVLSFWLHSLYAETSTESITVCFVFPWLYLGVCYYFMPEPDMNELGLFGSMIDNPFSYTDDINRAKLWLKIVMLPGNLLAIPFATIFKERVSGQDRRGL